MDENDETPATPGEGKHAGKAKRTGRKAAKTQLAPDAAAESAPTPPVDTPTAEAGEPKPEWKSKLPDPHGHHGTLVSNQGHRVRELFGRQFHQQKIFFTAPEGINPKPDRKYLDMMDEMGWKWRNTEGMWEKQMLTPEQSAEVRQLREDGKREEANALKWRYTDPGWLECQRDYHKLVETMRADAGLPPSEIITDNLKFLDRAR